MVPGSARFIFNNLGQQPSITINGCQHQTNSQPRVVSRKFARFGTWVYHFYEETAVSYTKHESKCLHRAYWFAALQYPQRGNGAFANRVTFRIHHGTRFAQFLINSGVGGIVGVLPVHHTFFPMYSVQAMLQLRF
jgi:hypothetical protein